jgi:hypothetical protein
MIVLVSIDAQIRAAERELRLREHVYPRWVETGKMTASAARNEIAAMRAIVDTLRDVQQKDGLFPPS